MKTYNVLLPSLDRQGPTILAMDLAYAAGDAGYQVTVMYLKERKNFFKKHNNVTFCKASFFNLLRTKNNLHSHCLFPDLLNSLISTKEIIFRRSFNSISTVPSYIYFDMRYSHGKTIAYFFWNLWKLLTRCIKHKVVLSETMKRFYNRFDSGYNYEVIYHSRPVETNKFGSKVKRGQVKKLIYIGVLNDRKNIISLIDHVAKATNLELDIYGCGPLIQHVKEKALHHNENITYCGFDSNISKKIGLYDCLVLPSFAEGLPTVVIEAANIGVPCLLSNIAVHRELESFGLGVVFDHRSFGNFNRKVLQLTQTARQREKRWVNHQHLFDFFKNSQRYRKLLDGE